jgi:hypothetical protein
MKAIYKGPHVLWDSRPCENETYWHMDDHVLNLNRPFSSGLRVAMSSPDRQIVLKPDSMFYRPSVVVIID